MAVLVGREMRGGFCWECVAAVESRRRRKWVVNWLEGFGLGGVKEGAVKTGRVCRSVVDLDVGEAGDRSVEEGGGGDVGDERLVNLFDWRMEDRRRCMMAPRRTERRVMD